MSVLLSNKSPKKEKTGLLIAEDLKCRERPGVGVGGGEGGGGGERGPPLSGPIIT
jgi:hypothetical protein